MLAFIAIQTMNKFAKTERETVSAFARPVTSPEPAPVVAYVSGEIADAFGMRGLPNTVVVDDPEPIPETAAVRASAYFNRKALVRTLQVSEKHGRKSPRRESVLTIGAAVSLETWNAETLVRQTIETDNAPELEGTGEPVAVSIPDAKISQVLRKLKADRVRIVATIEADDSTTVRIEADGGQFTIAAENADRWETANAGIDAQGKPCHPYQLQPVRDFLKLHTGDFAATWGTVVTAGELRNAIARTIFATDTQSTRYALGGILFEAETADRCVFAATDSRRLSVNSIDSQTVGTFPEETADRRPFVISTEAVRLLSDCIDRIPDADAVTIAAAGTEFCFESDAFSIRGKQVDGRFPRYRDVIPRSGFNVVATFEVKPLQHAIETAAIVCDDENRGTTFRFHGGTLEISGSSPAFGKSAVNVLAIPSAHRSLSNWETDCGIDFDPKYVLEYLKTTTADRVTFRIVDSETAAILQDSDCDDSTYVIMPLSRER